MEQKQRKQQKQNYLKSLLNLKQRFNNCYDQYLDHTKTLKKDQLIEAAAELVTYQEVHCEMTFWLVLSMSADAEWPNGQIQAPISEVDVVYLLSLENPLKELADKWWYHTMASKADFHGFFDTNFRNGSEVGG